MTRFQLYKEITGDSRWGQAPIWLEQQYFKFCEVTGEKPNTYKCSNGYELAMILPEQQESFDRYLESMANQKRI